MPEKLIVVIPTALGSRLLGRALASLAECRLPDGYGRTIVVENGPPRGARQIVGRADGALKAEYQHVAAPGKNVALNVCLAELDDETLVVFSDDDVRYAPEWLAAYADAAASAAGSRYFGGPTGADYETPPPDWLRAYLPPSAAGWIPAADDKYLAEGTFLGFNWAACVGDLRRAGLFDPALGPGTAIGTGDEPEMQLRLRQTGVSPVYVAGAMVWHDVPTQSCSQRFALDRWHRSSILHGRRRADEGGKKLFGVPRYKLRRCLAEWLACTWTRWTARDERARFAARYQFARTWGLVKGMYLEHRARRSGAPKHSPRAGLPTGVGACSREGTQDLS